MKVTVDAARFRTALETVNKTVKSFPECPVMEQIRVEVKNGICTLTGSNLEQFLVANFPVQGGEAFTCVLQRPKLALKASKHFSGELILDYDGPGHVLRLENGQRSCELFTTEDEYPSLPPLGDDPDVYTTNAARLNSRYGHIKYATVNDKERPAFGGIRFLDDRLAAIGRQRMAINKDGAFTVRKPFILPAPAMKLLPLFGDAEISLSVGKLWSVMASEELRLYTRLLALDTFDVDAPIPKQFRETYTVDPNQYAKELHYLNEFVTDIDHTQAVFENGALTVSTARGQFRTEVDVEGSAQIKYAVAPQYMMEAMGQFKDTGRVTVNVNAASGAIVLTEATGENLALVLPMRLRESAAA